MERKYTLTISKITRYEILKSAQIQKENKLLKLLYLLERFEITEEVIIVAAILYQLFKKKDQGKNFQDADNIIAATSFLNNSPLLTANRTDYPYPSFEENQISPILYRRIPNKTDCLLLCLLTPNTIVMRREIEKLFQK